jgi:hypothetical protein
MKAYISGAIASDSNFVRKFANAANMVAYLKPDWQIVNPVLIEACHTDWPTCEGTWSDNGLEFKHTWQCYMRHDLAELVFCDVIVMLFDWEASPGARFERDVAKKLGLPVWYLAANNLVLEGEPV